MKKLLLLFTFQVIVSQITFSQVIIPAANTNNGSVNDPFGTYYGFERSAMIYTSAQIGTTGNITSVGFYVNSVSSQGNSVDVRIYMKTRTTLMTASTTYATETTGATLVFGPANIPSASFVANNWINIPLTTPFNYTGGSNNLEIIIETNATGTGNEGSSGKQFRYTTQSTIEYFQNWNQDNTYPTGNGTRSTNRPNVRLEISSQPSITLSNLAETSSLSTNFKHRRGASDTPKFTINASSSFNQIQFELNTKSDFTGTAYISTINDGTTYTSSTLHDFFTTTALPAGNRTYFVRARASNNSGTNYGSWTTELWPYSFYSGTSYQQEGWYFTSKEQFQLGTVNETGYNFLSINDNSTVYPDDDNYFINQGSFSIPIVSGSDDGARENGWYGTSSFIDFGYINNGCASTDIVNLYRFKIFKFLQEVPSTMRN